MKFQINIVLIFLLFNLGLKAQEKHEIRTYTIATTYEKLKKDYPFIKPIQPLNSENIISREDVVYKKVEGKELKADVYIPNSGESKLYPAVMLIHGGDG